MVEKCKADDSPNVRHDRTVHSRTCRVLQGALCDLVFDQVYLNIL
jgi:hypothetical protein